MSIARLSFWGLLFLAVGPLPNVAQGQTGVITTIAGVTPVGGAPVRGFSGDGGLATSAMLALSNEQTICNPTKNGIFSFDEITHIGIDRSGNVYIADSANQRIRRINPQGVITTVAGNGQTPPINSRCESIGGPKDIGDGGPATAAKLYFPADVQSDAAGNLYIADQQNNRIRKVLTDGSITTIAGSGVHNFFAPGVPATSSPMDWPSAVALDANGTVYFAEIHGHRIGKIGSDGRMAVVAGTGFPGFNGDNQPATNAQLFAPSAVAVDGAGNLYIADQQNHRIRKVTPSGAISTVAGNGDVGFAADGVPATSTTLFYPNDVKVDAAGNLYIADMANNRIRRVDASGIITTVAGNGRLGRGPDNVAATTSSLSLPSGIAFDGAGSLYIADWQNYLIRKVSFNPAPAITPGGIVNAASFAPAPVPVAPGSIIAVFGVNLAGSTALAADIPLPTQLAGTSVSVNGTLAPLFFVSPTQINAQLPFEIAAGTATAVVNTASGASRSETFNVASFALGIFQFPGTNRAVVLNQDGTVNGAGNPEAGSNYIVAFLTGQGVVAPAVATGQAAPLDPLSRPAGNATANIGGQSAEVAFLGLTPGFVGLAQANIRIPAGVTPGDRVMFVSVGGQASNTAIVSVK